MNLYAVVFFTGAVPALVIGWAGGTLYERNKHVTTSPLKRVNRDTLLIALVVTALVAAVVAAVYAGVGQYNGQQRDNRNFNCLTNYVSTQQKNSAPATVANRAQSAAWRDYEQGFSTEPDAKTLNKEQLKVRWLSLYKAYENVQTPPLPDLRSFCEENR